MVIYYFFVKVISCVVGVSVVVVVVYCLVLWLCDVWLDCSYDFLNKVGVVYFEVMLFEGVLVDFGECEWFWNVVEVVEICKDVQLVCEIEFVILREMSQVDGIVLVRDFVQCEFVDWGMIVDFNVYWDIGVDGLVKLYVYVMLIMWLVD